MRSDPQSRRRSTCAAIALTTVASFLPSVSSAQDEDRENTLFLLGHHLLAAAQAQLVTFPIATGAGAFTYVFDPATRTFTRRSQSFGSRFVERATTLGRRHVFSVGMSVQPVVFQALDGRRLSGTPLYWRQRHPDGSTITDSVAFQLKSVMVAPFAVYAVTPAVDVTVVVPISEITFRAIGRGTVTADTGRRTSRGLGDMEVRAKWGAVRTRRVDLSAEYGLRLPTGSAGTLIPHGTGGAQQKLSALLTTHAGAVQPHVNVSYAWRVAGKSPGDAVAGETRNFLGLLGPGTTSHELAIAAGAEWAPQRRLTLSGDYVGRLLQDNIRWEEQTTDRYPYEGAPPFGYLLDSVHQVPHDVYLAVGAAGAKYRIAGNVLVSWHVLFPLSSGGLRPGVSSVFGWEYSF